MDDAPHAEAIPARRWRVDGEPPFFENLGASLRPAPELLDQLVTEFAPIGDTLHTQRAWWLAFHVWMIDRLGGADLRDAPDASVTDGVWCIYATGYWSMLEQQRNFGIPPGVINLGMQAREPGPDSVADLVAKLADRLGILAEGGNAALRELPRLLREEPCTGTLHGAAYNSGYIEVICEFAPLGEVPEHLAAMDGAIRANARDFLRLDYGVPVPQYLVSWRRRFEIAARHEAERFEEIISGSDHDKDLRQIWSEALEWGHNNWGGDSLRQWTQDYYDDCAYWSIVFNFAIEAAALASFVALLEQDEQAGIRAVRANTLYLGSWGAAVMGLLDPTGRLPDIVPIND